MGKSCLLTGRVYCRLLCQIDFSLFYCNFLRKPNRAKTRSQSHKNVVGIKGLFLG